MKRTSRVQSHQKNNKIVTQIRFLFKLTPLKLSRSTTLDLKVW